MKILKAIVDELPGNCAQCGYYVSTEDKSSAIVWYCRIHYGDSMQTILGRPDWCPLIKKGDTPLEDIDGYIFDKERGYWICTNY